MVEIRAETRVGLHVKRPLSLSDFNPKWDLLTDVLTIKFHQNPFTDSALASPLSGRVHRGSKTTWATFSLYYQLNYNRTARHGKAT
jgi:hypothetical protein